MSVVIFVVVGLVFAGECKGGDIFAWGSGSCEDRVCGFVNDVVDASNNLLVDILNLNNNANVSLG